MITLTARYILRTAACLLTGWLLLLGATMPAAAASRVWVATLNGASEAPPNASTATGNAIITVDTVANTLRVQSTFSGLTGTVTAAHIHCCTAAPVSGTAGVATQVPTFQGFPSGVTSGTYDATFDMTLVSSFNPAFLTANGGTTATAFAALAAGIEAGRAYLNIHTTFAPGGEIRGFGTEIWPVWIGRALIESATSCPTAGSGLQPVVVGQTMQSTFTPGDVSNNPNLVFHNGRDATRIRPTTGTLSSGGGTFSAETLLASFGSAASTGGTFTSMAMLPATATVATPSLSLSGSITGLFRADCLVTFSANYVAVVP